MLHKERRVLTSQHQEPLQDSSSQKLLQFMTQFPRKYTSSLPSTTFGEKTLMSYRSRYYFGQWKKNSCISTPGRTSGSAMIRIHTVFSFTKAQWNCICPAPKNPNKPPVLWLFHQCSFLDSTTKYGEFTLFFFLTSRNNKLKSTFLDLLESWEKFL